MAKGALSDLPSPITIGRHRWGKSLLSHGEDGGIGKRKALERRGSGCQVELRLILLEGDFFKGHPPRKIKRLEMTLEQFIDTYGYWAVLIGTFFEGETILVLGGFAAYRRYLALPWVILAAFLGTLAGDQLFFILGRKYSSKILARRPYWQSRVDKVQKLLERFQTLLILMFRFMYGFRSVTPFVIGMSSVGTRRFVLLNALGALVWAVIVGAGGYLFGSALEILLGELKHYEIEILGALATVGFFIWMIHFLRRRRAKASST